MAFEAERRRMVREQLEGRDITDPRVLAAFLHVPRHHFVPKEAEQEAYADRPIPIGSGQTISQPYMVALMIQLLRLQGSERVLEIGTGAGYQAAILAELALEVFSMERLPELASRAVTHLAELEYLNVHVTAGNGWSGWAEHAPYEGIVVAAGTSQIPPMLMEQLSDGGRLVVPLGTHDAQTLTLVEKRGGNLQTKAIASCVFVPLIGEGGPLSDPGP